MQQLYRLFSAEDELLYIGISVSALARFAQHKADKPWIGEVARVAIETHDCARAEIEALERSAIIQEKPKYNIVHANSQRDLSKTTKAGSLRPQYEYRWLGVGDVVAIGLRNGQCPVGIIVADSYSDQRLAFGDIVLSLYSWMTEEFGHRQQLVRTVEIEQITTTCLISEPGSWRDGTFDMDPLSEFQTRWLERCKTGSR
jgi:hypothetical protein